MGTKQTRERKPPKEKTPTFLLELPLEVEAGQAARLRAHLEAGRQFYNAVLSAGQLRLRQMRADPAWQEARAISRTHTQERQAAYSALREQYGFSEYAFHELARALRVSWLADHLDLGPASIAIVPREAEARLEKLGAELRPDERVIRRLQRRMERQRRASNPEHYDERGRVKKRGKGAKGWKQSRGYQATRRRKADRERRMAAHRKSLHGQLVHQIVAVGHTVSTEKISYRGWQKRYGRSVGLRAPGMLIDQLRRTVASTGGTLLEVPTSSMKLSQYCHGCGQTLKKPHAPRWHQCPCGIGPVQCDLYSAFLAAYLDLGEPIPSCARYVVPWEGAGAGGEARLRAAHERVQERANEGQVVPRSMGISRAGARLPTSPSEATPELLFLSRRGKVEAWKRRPEPSVLEPGESSVAI
jgi:hypothetical protein